jgi:hypothetical protein
MGQRRVGGNSKAVGEICQSHAANWSEGTNFFDLKQSLRCSPIVKNSSNGVRYVFAAISNIEAREATHLDPSARSSNNGPDLGSCYEDNGNHEDCNLKLNN